MSRRGQSPVVLVIDQGTTTSKALMVDASGAVIAKGHATVPITFPRPGWVEQDANHIWESVLEAIYRCMLSAPDTRPDVVAISNQRESVVAWDRSTNRPAGPVLGWQDARTADHCTRLGSGGGTALVRDRTGLALDPMFSAPKMAWLRQHALSVGVSPSALALGTVDSWLIACLTGGSVFAAEAGNASRTLLFDLARLDWHDELLDLFDVPRSALGRIAPSDGSFGVTVATGPVPSGLPIVAVMADSHAALYTHAAREHSAAKATYGTGSSVMARLTDLKPAPTGISTTLAWMSGDQAAYAREGNVLATGAALDWTASLLGCGPHEAGGAFLTRLAADARDAGGVVLVPAFTGLGAPYWDRRTTGMFTGLTSGTSPANLAHAALDAVAHQVTDVVEAVVSDAGITIDVLSADGGATASRLLMNKQADLLGRPVHVAAFADGSPRGAALLALAALGVAAAPAATAPTVVTPTLAPPGREVERRAWHDAIRRVRWQPEDDPDTSPQVSTHPQRHNHDENEDQ